MWKERVVLEDGIHIAIKRWQVGYLFITERDDSFIRILESCNHAKDCCLAGTRGAEEGYELSRFDLQRDTCDCGYRAEGLAKIANLNQRHLRAPDLITRRNNRGRLSENE